MASTHIWQGFRHEWLREVLGFRLPHRISRLHSLVTEDGRFAFAQSTGVDGNFMKPVGYWARLECPDVEVVHGDVTMAWRDEVAMIDAVPVASSRRVETLRLDLAPGTLPGEAILRGFRLDTRCCDEHQPSDHPCNSNGFWPVSMSIRLGDVRVEDGAAMVDVETTLVRGWTPMRGGIPFVEEKPLNVSLDYRLEVGVTLLTSADGRLEAHRSRVEMEGSARRRKAHRAVSRVEAVSAPTLAVGITGFAFEFGRGGSGRFYDHRGRYLSALDFHVGNVMRRDDAVEIEHEMGVWIPRTVVGTDVRTSLETTLLQLRPPNARVERGRVEGSLCIHSSDQAPFFSSWRPRPGRFGPIQSEDERELP